MKYYRDAQNNVYAYESNGSQDSYIKPGMVSITKETADALRKPLALVPIEVEMAQARLALLQGGHLQRVNDYISGIVGVEGDKYRIEWEFRQKVRRDHPLVNALRLELQLTDLEMDALFKLAITL